MQHRPDVLYVEVAPLGLNFLTDTMAWVAAFLSTTRCIDILTRRSVGTKVEPSVG